jgi:hypothetical protein
MSDRQIGRTPITCIAVRALKFSRIEFERGQAMKRNKRWRAQWGSFLMGVCIGLLIVTPVLATPASGLPPLVLSESNLPLPTGNAMLDSAALLISLMIAQVVSAAHTARSRLVDGL